MKQVSLNDLPIERVSHNASIQKKVMLRSGDLPHLINFAQATFAPGQVAPGHAHQDMCEVFFIESGTGNMCVDGIDYLLSPGTCIAVEPGEVHEVSNRGTEDLVITYFGIVDS
jgi:quercetin dioxygenase-like cupin family protein